MTKKEITIENLKLLRDAWKQKSFEPVMWEYGGIQSHSLVNLKVEQVNDCGTSCCGLGLAPSVKGLEIVASDFRYNDYDDIAFSYNKYSERIFPEIEVNYQKWNFIFSEYWANDRIQLIKRMTHMIENDLVLPMDWVNDDYTYTL